MGRIFGDNTQAPASTGGGRIFSGNIDNNALTAGITTNADVYKRMAEGNERKRQQQEIAKKNASKTFVDRGLEGVQRAFTTDLGKNVGDILTAGRETFIDPAVRLGQQAQLGGNIAAKGAGPVQNQASADQLKRFVDEDLKAGRLTKQQAEAKKNKIQTEITRTKQIISGEEKKAGVKFDQNEGVMALIDTVSNVTGLAGLGKSLLAKSVEKAATKVGRELAPEEVQAIADRIKVTTKKPQTETPSLETPLAQKPEFKAAVSPDLAETPRLNTSIKTLPINELKIGGNTFDPAGLDTNQVGKYITDLQAGKTLDPIVVSKGEGGKYFVEDGKHRLAAAQELGITNIPVVEQTAKTAMKASGNAVRLEKLAVEKNLTNTLGDLPEYATINMKDQATRAVDLVDNDRQLALDIIDGKRNAPDNLRPQSVHQALEQIAIKEGNTNLLTKLAKSNINTELSTSAQNLRIAAERTPNSPVELIRQVQDARVKAISKRSKKSPTELVNTTKQQIASAVPKTTKQDWAGFISSLGC